ncbi:hypothetical protein BDW67DRAFT_3122 [Aspergillus spinulosporus]
MTYDSRWLYTGDPLEIPPLEGDTLSPGWEEDSAGSDSNSNSSFNSKFGDVIPYYHDGVLNGDQPGQPWRVRPDPDTFHPVARALAAAVLRMPELTHTSLGTALCDAMGYEVDFEYLAPGLTTCWMPDADQTLEQGENTGLSCRSARMLNGLFQRIFERLWNVA